MRSVIQRLVMCYFLMPIAACRPVSAKHGSQASPISTDDVSEELKVVSSSSERRKHSRSRRPAWSLDAVLRWSAENRRARASPPPGAAQRTTLPCLPRTNVCCSRGRSHRNVGGGAGRQWSSSSAAQGCERIHTCKAQFCRGRAPLSCLLGAGYHGRPTVTYSSHIPLAKLHRQGGYGVGIDRGFRVSETDPSQGAQRESVHGIATTDVTDLRFNFGLLRAAGYRVGRFSADVRLGGARELCAKYNARIVLRVTVRARQGQTHYRHVVTRQLSFRGQGHGETLLNISMGCSNSTASPAACRLHLDTSLRTTPPEMRGRLRSLCWAFWADAHVAVASPESPCQTDCSDEVLLSCLKHNHAQQGTKLVRYSQQQQQQQEDEEQTDSAISEQIVRPAHEGLSSQSSNSAFIAQWQALLEAGRLTETDVILPVSPAASSIDYNPRPPSSGSRRWEILTGRLNYFAPDPEHLAACANLSSGDGHDGGTAVRVTILVDGRVVLRRTLHASAAAPIAEDIGPFAVALRDRNARVTVTATSSSAVNSRGHGDDDGTTPATATHCGLLAVVRARLTSTEGSLQFGKCQNSCFSDLAATGRVPLSCFLGKMRTRGHGFACAGSVTRRSDRNPFVRIALANTASRIGVDRAGRWSQQLPVALQTTTMAVGNGSSSGGGGLQRVVFERAIGAHPDSRIDVNLTAFRAAGLRFTHFSSTVGLDVRSRERERTARDMGGAQFRVLLDGRLSFSTDVVHAWATKKIIIDVADSLQMSLLTMRAHLQRPNNRASRIPAVWADPTLENLVHSPA